MGVRRGGLGVVSGMIAIACGSGCGESLLNQTASLGSATAGQRGTLRVLFINNTPYQAVFTYGSYDQHDQDSQPDFEQFGLQDFPAKLDGDSMSSISVTNTRAFIDCARVFAIGSDRLHEFIRQHVSDVDLVSEAMVEGVEFLEIPAQDELSNQPRSVGFAPPFEALLGVDFPCQALLVIRFERNDLGPAAFRVDFELIPPESDR